MVGEQGMLLTGVLQDLVMAARGKLKERNWRRGNGDPATIDDITVFVIPILPYKHEYLGVQVRIIHFFFILLFGDRYLSIIV